MLCFLSVRKLRPGTYDDFRTAWEPDEMPDSFVKAYHLRSTNDPDKVVSFGFVDATLDSLNEWRVGHSNAEDARQQRMARFIDTNIVDEIFEVADVVEPAALARS